MSTKLSQRLIWTGNVNNDVPPKAGCAEWLRAHLAPAIADLDNPTEKLMEHEQVFAELDHLIAKHKEH